jgi:membrane-bound lytic murein transglycosylase D
MKQITALFFICFSILVIAQESTHDTLSANDVKHDSIVKTIPLKKIDSVEVVKTNPQIIKNEVTPVTETYINEDLSMLSDDEYAKLIDDLWFSELDNSNLNINNTISNVIIDDSELSTEVFKQRLAYLNSKTPFNVEYNEILERIVKSYIKNKKEKYAKLLTKSAYYFPMIEAQLAKYEIPLEMKYLAVVESALNPTIKSPVGATGLWQFMYQTGKQFDLNVSSYVDERSDAQKSTEAACKYLKSLYNTFQDWDLALAAYNSGPGNVSKAIRRAGGSKNYWNIRHHLPRETASYVPIFYATMYMFEFANVHNIKATPNYMQFYEVDSLRVKRQITFDQITQAIPIEKNVLKFLNPQYKLEIIPVIKGRDYSLTLPKTMIGEFVQNEERIYAFAVADDAKREKPLPKYTEMNNRIRYKVKKGDFLGKIARHYGVSVAKIKRWNGMKSTRLKIGQRLTIYPRRM